MKELFYLLPAAFRRRAFYIAGTLLLRALLNFLGLALLLPVLTLLLDAESLTGGGRLARIYAMSGLNSPRTFIYVVCGCVVVAIALKCLLATLLSRIERRYIYQLYRTLSRQLYTTYHHRGLPYIKSSGAATLARNVNIVALRFTTGILRPIASLAADAMLIVLLAAALALWMPAAALLAIVVFALVAGCYFLLVRKRADRYGEIENRAQREKARIVSETFRGYADIELSGAFPQMLQAFDRTIDEVIRSRSHEADAAQLPGMLTETGVATGMALLVAVSLGQGNGHAQLLFGVFAVAALRLMPSVRNILTGWATIRYNRYTISILRDAIADAVPATDRISEVLLPFEREISIRNLRFRFSEREPELFGGMSFAIHRGERIGFKGSSGAGKSTLFNLLLGFYEPTSGTIVIDDTPLTAANRRAWQNRIGYVSQQLFITDGSFAENVALGATNIDRRRVEEALEAAQLGTFVGALTQGMDTPVGECGCRLSGGQRQRIGIARALYRRADVLIFDEATSALDDRTEEEVRRAIADLARQHPGLTLLIAAHRETSLAECDRIITIGI